MLSFSVVVDGNPVEALELSSAHLIGTDDVTLRAEFTLKDGILECKKRAAGPAGLVLPWTVKGQGRFLLETSRLLERDRPYILQLELVRGRLIRILQKFEEWGLYDTDFETELMDQYEAARDLLIRGMQADSVELAAALGDEALPLTLSLSDALTERHSKALCQRRRESLGVARPAFGCAVDRECSSEALPSRLKEGFDFVTLCMPWRFIEIEEQKTNFKPFDTWIESLRKNKIQIAISPLLSFEEIAIPDWLYIYEHDFETIRDLAEEHVKRVVNRYGKYVHRWVVASGLHASNALAFTFEQLMELTRMSAAVVRRLAPRGTTIIEITDPWGEYYAGNPRSIPPTLYAEMVTQSGIAFDAIGLKIHVGQPDKGAFNRDFFHISDVIDTFGAFGKPIHVTSVEAPSKAEATNGRAVAYWREPWTEKTQGDWLSNVYCLAASRPYVESISWGFLNDVPTARVAHSGLLNADGSTRHAYNQAMEFRRLAMSKDA